MSTDLPATVADLRAMATAMVIDLPGADDLPSIQALTPEERALARAHATIASLRAVLAPLLDEPLIENRCRCCKRTVAAWTRVGQEFIDLPHAPDCAVLRRDELLGR